MKSGDEDDENSTLSNAKSCMWEEQPHAQVQAREQLAGKQLYINRKGDGI